MKRFAMLAVGVLASLVLLATPAGAITGNFVPDNEHPYVGLAAFYDANGNFMWRCSGALITDRVFLTAGHCTDQNAAESPAMVRIWFEQDVGSGFNPTTGAEDPRTGYPNECLAGDPLCVESTLLYDFGFDNFAGFPNIHDVGLVILPADQAVSLPEYGQLHLRVSSIRLRRAGDCRRRRSPSAATACHASRRTTRRRRSRSACV